MNKTKSKVLSLVLASAMIVSSFSSLNFASAATTREKGTVKGFEATTLYLVSSSTNDDLKVPLSDLIGTPDMETYDHEEAGAAEFDSVSYRDDKVVNVTKDKDGVAQLSVRNKSGKGTLVVNYETEYDRDGKDVTVRASKEITVYVDKIGSEFVGEATEGITASGVAKRPGELSGAAVNDATLEIGVYKAEAKGDTDNEAKITANYTPVTLVKAADETTEIKVDKANKAFAENKADLLANITPSSGLVTVKTSYQEALTTPGSEKDEKLASTGTATLELKLSDGEKDSFEDVKISVDKKIRAESGTEINKKGGSTYLTKTGTWDDDWKTSEMSKKAYSIKGYDVVAKGSLTVTGGTVGNISGKTSDITVDGGNVGDVSKVKSVTVRGGSVETIKDTSDDKDVTESVTVEDGKVKDINTEGATVEVSGGTVTNSVIGETVTVDASDDDIDTSIGKDITAKGDSDNDVEATVDIGESSSDAALKIGGTVKGIVNVYGGQADIAAIDADFGYTVTFEDFTGKIGTIKNSENAVINLNGESKVSLKGKINADEIAIDEDSKLAIEEGNIGTVSGDGVFAVPAGKLFIQDELTDITLQLTDGLVAGETAFTSYSNSVDVDDFNTLGFDLDQKSASKDTDKFVIKNVKFAGVKFDKTELKIAKGYSDTVTVANYPSGTALPAGYSIEWDVDANDDYISVTTDGNTATIKALDYNADLGIDNQGTITATVVDEDGTVVEDLLEATINVTAIEKQPSVVTLDTTKPVTVGIGAVYQYLANSSVKGSVMTATSSDTQIATVEPFNLADPRGYKFQVKGIAEGTATITTTDANGATATLTVNVVKSVPVTGTLKADTTTYTFAPGAIYDVKFSTTGTTAVPVVTVNGKVVSIAPRGNGVYRVTAQNAGTAFVVATVGNTHVSVKFVVAPGAVKSGVTGNNVSILK